MDTDIFKDFLTTACLTLLIGCYGLTWIIRRGIETAWPKLRPLKKGGTEVYLSKFADWWNSFILYLIPPAVGLGLGAGLYKHFEWPATFKTLQGVMFFGMVCGWLSGLLFKLLIRLLTKRLTGEDDKQAAEDAKDPVVAGAKEDKKPGPEPEKKPE